MTTQAERLATGHYGIGRAMLANYILTGGELP